MIRKSTRASTLALRVYQKTASEPPCSMRYAVSCGVTTLKSMIKIVAKPKYHPALRRYCC